MSGLRSDCCNSASSSTTSQEHPKSSWHAPLKCRGLPLRPTPFSPVHRQRCVRVGSVAAAVSRPGERPHSCLPRVWHQRSTAATES